VLTGCYSPAGGWLPRTGGAITYESTEESPKTITLIDLRTEEAVFTMDIPVGKQLTIDFEAGDGDDPVNTPDLMSYAVLDRGSNFGRLNNSISVPNAASRRINMTIRSGVEFPQAPVTAGLRTDQAADRPDWWSSRGGRMPEDRTTEMYDN